MRSVSGDGERLGSCSAGPRLFGTADAGGEADYPSAQQGAPVMVVRTMYSTSRPVRQRSATQVLAQSPLLMGRVQARRCALRILHVLANLWSCQADAGPLHVAHLVCLLTALRQPDHEPAHPAAALHTATKQSSMRHALGPRSAPSRPDAVVDAACEAADSFSCNTSQVRGGLRCSWHASRPRTPRSSCPHAHLSVRTGCARHTCQALRISSLPPAATPAPGTQRPQPRAAPPAPIPARCHRWALRAAQ